MTMKFLLPFIFILVFSSSLWALEEGGSYPVTRVIDGDTLVLDGNEHVRLLGIQAPEIGRKGEPDQPFARDAHQALRDIVEGQRLRVVFDARKKDRYGRWLAHLYLPDGRWVQGVMVSDGMARVYSFADNRAKVRELLALESAARKQGLGLWGWPAYHVHKAQEKAAIPMQTYGVIEGRLHKVAEVRGHLYLNFEENWREDVTFFIHRKSRDRFDLETLFALEGQRVRGRGWVFPKNGPMIEISHPEQLEWGL